MDSEILLDRAAQGDLSASDALLALHKDRLRAMVAMRLDARLAARLDPSDIVQEALVEAHRKLPHYLAKRDIPFYPWLRKIAWEKLVQMHRRHIGAERRTVRREASRLDLSGHSKMMLVDRLADRTKSPSEQLVRDELRDRLQKALAELPARDYEVIVLKHMEEMTFPEAAAVMELSEEAVRSRYRRAVERLHRRLNRD